MRPASVWCLFVTSCTIVILLLTAPLALPSAAQDTTAPTLVIFGTYATPLKPPPTAIPPAAPTPIVNDDVLTILVLGSDTDKRRIVSRTDSIIVVVINRTHGTVSLMYLPRDMYVYVPNETMHKLNTVAALGIKRYGSENYVQLLRETLLYNFGIKVDFFARIGFTEFREIINALGGLRISVDCAIEGNRLISPELDPHNPESYQVFRMDIGVHRMDADTALWYARARGSSTDMDRGRRQMEILTAIWRQARDMNLFAQATEFVPRLLRIVDTDMTAADLLGLVPLALSLDLNRVQHINLVHKQHFTQWYTSDSGTFTWLPIPEAMARAVQDLYTPPTRNRLQSEAPIVAVAAAAPLLEYRQVAAERLMREGFNVTLLDAKAGQPRNFTLIYDYTGGAKPHSLTILKRALRVSDRGVIAQPDPNAPYDFRVEIGYSYPNSCEFKIRQ
ncbi:MAG: LCP family protein [Anaerolineae bacterium]|nr:LCP family protein [Anaerolineae bacterium]MDW8298204.1 LCP family protein [Anaerolineae bacterium]